MIIRLSQIDEFLRNLVRDFLSTARYLVGTPFRSLMLFLWILSLSLLLYYADDMTMNDEIEKELPPEPAKEQVETDTAVAFAYVIPMILTTIALAYTFKEDLPFDVKTKTDFKYWPLWALGSFFLFIVGSALFMLVGVFWFMFETVILTLTATSAVKLTGERFSGTLGKTRATRAVTLLILNAVFLLPAFWLHNLSGNIYEVLKVKDLEKTPDFFGPLVGGTIILTITVWALFIYWERKSTPISKELLQMLPWMFSLAMLICYFEVMKGLFIISELKWMRLWASPIEICTALFVLVIALMSVTSNVRETLDVDIPHGVLGVMRVDLKALVDQFTIGERNIIPLSIRKLIPSSVPTYALVLWVLVLYLSKHYFENILGIHEELMLAAIIFTFISLFMLSLRIRSML